MAPNPHFPLQPLHLWQKRAEERRRDSSRLVCKLAPLCLYLSLLSFPCGEWRGHLGDAN